MIREPRNHFLQNSVEKLVKKFGFDQVKAALRKAKKTKSAEGARAAATPREAHGRPPNVTAILEELRNRDAAKHRILISFYANLKTKKVLPESQDIRQFAQIIGLKEINGKSRKDLIPKLIRFLKELPIEQLETSISGAGDISEQQRQEGFSVLTEKLLEPV